MDSEYASRIATLGRALGIPADYAAVRRLRLQREAKKLLPIECNSDGRVIRLSPRAAAAWRRMQGAAASAGIELVPVSGFRSVARQAEIIRGKMAAGAKIDAILKYVAAPGYSEHHTGRALDLAVPDGPVLDESFARTAAFRWLQRNARRFGFHLSYPRKNAHGIGHEPWHWCWRATASD
jgi:D-alanyl-D-alanine carboxypeptidase